VAERKRGCLGCSFPILIGILIVFIVLFILGFLAGPIGKSLIGDVGLPGWLSVPRPEPHLPAPEVFNLFGLPITNTILAGWFTVVVVVLFCFFVTRRMKIVPGRVQAAFEFLLGWVYDLCQGIAGEENGRRFFPVICTIFLFVAFNAWLSLIPGFGSILIGHHELIRGANTDVNTTLAIALVSFVFVIFYGLKDARMGFVRQYFNFGPFFHSVGQVFKGKFNMMDIFSGAIGIFVGFLELLSLFIRNVSFTFRLFGNMTAGEILLLIAAFLVPWVLALPFYGLEMLVGFVQALIFAGLTLVFVTMAVTPHEAESH
jgi:F-type H+-transporting ATPase subunit a